MTVLHLISIPECEVIYEQVHSKCVSFRAEDDRVWIEYVDSSPDLAGELGTPMAYPTADNIRLVGNLCVFLVG